MAFSIQLSEILLSGVVRIYWQDIERMHLSRSIASLFGVFDDPNNNIVQITSFQDPHNTFTLQRNIFVQFLISVTQAIKAVLEGNKGIYSRDLYKVHHTILAVTKGQSMKLFETYMLFDLPWNIILLFRLIKNSKMTCRIHDKSHQITTPIELISHLLFQKLVVL